MSEINKSEIAPGYEAVTDYLKEQHALSIVKPITPESNDGIFIPITAAADLVRHIGTKPPLFLTIPNMACLIIVAGMGKVGKSLLLELLCITLASKIGIFFGMPAAINLRCLLVSYEEFFENRSMRALRQFASMDDDLITLLSKNYYVLKDGYFRYLSTDKQRADFLNKLIEFAPEILVIDSLSRIYAGSIENSSEAQEIMRFLRSIADILGIPVIVIHHTRKIPPGTPLTLDLMAGSRLVSSEADFVLGVGKGAGGTRYIKPLAFRYANDEWDELPTFKINEYAMAEYTGSFREDEILSSAMQTSSNDSNKQRIEKYLSEKCSVSTKDLEHEFVATKIMARSTLFDAVKRSPSIVTTEKGVYSHKDCINNQNSIMDEEK